MNSAARYTGAFDLWRSTRCRSKRCEVRSIDDLTVLPFALSALAIAIGILYWPVLRWTLDKFLLSIFHWHWFVAAISLLCALRANTHRMQPSTNNAASVLLVLCVIAEVANQRTLQIQLLSAVLLIVTLHAFTGHLIENSQWRAMKWPMVVGVALLPLDFYLEPYFGYPLRLLTASIADYVLQGFGFATLSSESILMVENQASVVDLDCSGINSLWAGGVFFLLLSWMTRLSVGFKWCMLGVLLVCLLLSANVARIVVLVVLDLNDLHGLSEIAHTSMGAVGFATSILVVWKCTEWLPKVADQEYGAVGRKSTRLLTLRWPVLPLVAVLLVGAAIPPREQIRAAVDYSNIELPAALQAAPIDMSTFEERFFEGNGALAVKYKLGGEDKSHSVVFVTSNWWKAQHKPEHCLQSMGFSIQDKRVLTLQPEADASRINAVTVLSMVDELQNKYTAVYWFQSATSMTSDHYRRMTDSIKHPNRRWTMTSLLLSGDIASAEILKSVSPIQQSIATSYEEQS